MDQGQDLPADAQRIDPNELKPQTPAELTNRGWIYYAQKDYSKAEVDLRRALGLNPNDVEILYPLALTLKAAGSRKEAVELFHRVVELVGTIENRVRANMIRRIATGHIHEIESGNWHLEAEIWNKT